uniref:Uncharacterized protein n=1 Tax=Clastoptera arizonana TaxID=38151 RepID=A0A1B6DV37_9HEMI
MGILKKFLNFILVELLFLTIVYSDVMNDLSYTYPHNLNSKYALFKDQESILSLFEKERLKQPEKVDEFLRAFNSCFFTEDIPVPLGVRRPFIVIEGNNRQNRETVAKMLADTIGAKYLHVPPKCLVHLTTTFDKGSLIRNAFFALSLYASAFNVRQLLGIGTPVVMNGYWTEQASFVIGKIYKRPGDLPPPGSEIYDQPKDLMMPDMLVFLNYPYTQHSFIFTTRSPGFMPKTNQIYKRFYYPPVTIIDSSRGIDTTVSQIYREMRGLLGDSFDFSPAIPYTLGDI